MCREIYYFLPPGSPPVVHSSLLNLLLIPLTSRIISFITLETMVKATKAPKADVVTRYVEWKKLRREAGGESEKMETGMNAEVVSVGVLLAVDRLDVCDR